MPSVSRQQGRKFGLFVPKLKLPGLPVSRLFVSTEYLEGTDCDLMRVATMMPAAGNTLKPGDWEKPKEEKGELYVLTPSSIR